MKGDSAEKENHTSLRMSNPLPDGALKRKSRCGLNLLSNSTRGVESAEQEEA